eukprot:COSAG05_NODE_639_length_8156_cov_122.162840_1_plen_187_part_00
MAVIDLRRLYASAVSAALTSAAVSYHGHPLLFLSFFLTFCSIVQMPDDKESSESSSDSSLATLVDAHVKKLLSTMSLAEARIEIEGFNGEDTVAGEILEILFLEYNYTSKKQFLRLKILFLRLKTQFLRLKIVILRLKIESLGGSLSGVGQSFQIPSAHDHRDQKPSSISTWRGILNACAMARQWQ